MSAIIGTTPQKGAGTTFWRLQDGQSIIADADYTEDTKWEKISKVKEITPGELTAEDEEDNYLDDPDADWVKTTSGQKSAGETQLTLAWMPGESNQQQLFADFDAGTITHYRCKYPNGAVDVWTGYINQLGKAVAIKEKMTRTVKIKNVGRPMTAEELLTPAPAV